ncbi:MAG: hypothetical protein BAJATHORv1_60068 [Candidatus Thorarchaeota archaeon]|nr:MAG: hypothetical protein BAJATHORv1_60068 [Candidatus Thorarchaeota archaeon]
MSELTITGLNRRGDSLSYRFTTDSEKVEIHSVDFVSVDLSELSKCRALKSLSLWNNSLLTIDFTPLMDLPSLQTISVSSNALTSVDLKPLSYIHSLETIHLSNNQFSSLDLSPLSTIPNLTNLYLNTNLLSYLDLGPLKYCDELRRLDLSRNQLESIDLSSLSNCLKLSELILENNRINEIDLEGLRTCKSLSVLSLAGNPITHLDLVPLSNCDALKELSLYDMGLQHIDLQPLGNCQNLVDLDLSYNRIKSINLDSLRNCEKLRELNLRENPFDTIDLTPFSTQGQLGFLDLSYTYLREIRLYPLSFCETFYNIQAEGTPIPSVDVTPLVFTQINTFDYMNLGNSIVLTILSSDTLSRVNPEFAGAVDQFDVPVFSNNLDYIRKLISLIVQSEEDDWKLIHLMRDVICSLNIQSLGIFDITKNELQFIQDEYNIDTIKSRLVDLFLDQRKKQGTTILVDVEHLSSISPEISLHVPDILKEREHELEKIVVPIADEIVDLKPLLCTAYGFQLCSALGLGISCKESELDIILKALNRLNMSVSVTENSEAVYPSGQSDALRKYLYALIDR